MDDPPYELDDVIDLLRARPEELVRLKIWKTRDGKLIPIEKLEDDHLENCIEMMRRNGYIEKSTFDCYLGAAGPSGDMAQHAFDQEVREIIKYTPSRMLDHLVDERRRRNPDTETP